jgi:hypothetical protein
MSRIRPCIALVALTIACTAFGASKRRRATSATTSYETNWAPGVAPIIGLGIPIAGASGNVGFKVGVKVDLMDLDNLLPGLQLILPVQATIVSPASGIEGAVGLEYEHEIGRIPLGFYVDLTAGYARNRFVVEAAQVGYQNTNHFVARLGVGLAYRFSKTVHAFLEPVNFGLYAGSGTAAEYAPTAGVGLSF